MLIKPRKWIVGLPWVCSCGKAHYVTEEDRRKNFIVCEHCGKFDVLFPGIQKANKVLNIILLILAILVSGTLLGILIGLIWEKIQGVVYVVLLAALLIWAYRRVFR